MKKLTLILSTVLLLSSTAAFAKSKAKHFVSDMGNNQTCLTAKKALDTISELPQIGFSGSCIGSNLKGKVTVHYLFTPTQKFEMQVSWRRNIGRKQMSLKYARALEKVNAPGISIKARPAEEYGVAFADTYYFVFGEISLKK